MNAPLLPPQPSGLPFEDIRALVRQLPGADEGAAAAVRTSMQRAPLGGRVPAALLDLAVWLARWQRHRPSVARPTLVLFAGTHGCEGGDVVEAGRAEVERVAAGGAAVAHVATTFDVGLKVFDLALEVPTGDIRHEAALSERDCAATVAFGMEAAAGGGDLLALAGLGRAGRIPALALLASRLGGCGTDWTVRQAEAVAVDAALDAHRAHLADPLEALRRLGGREAAAMLGAALACRHQGIPIVFSGTTALAAMAVLRALNPALADHCRLACPPADRPSAAAAAQLGFSGFLDADMDADDGTPAVLSVAHLRAAAALASAAR